MKSGKLMMLKLRWRVTYIARTTLPKAKDWAARALARAARECTAAWQLAKRAWNAAGYYVALGALLVIVGVAAHAYRTQPTSGAAGGATAEPPVSNEAAWSDLSLGTPQPTVEPFSLIMPVEGDVIADYVTDSLIWSDTLGQWQTHAAIDIAAEMGEVVRAAEAGEIVGAYSDVLMGNVIEIRHDNGYMTRYASLNTLALVSIGQRVAKGDTISSAGNSGSAEASLGTHVHFELLVDGRATRPEFGGVGEYNP